MTRVRAAAGSLLFLGVAPGVVAGLVPWLITGWKSTGPPVWLQVLGWLLIVAGAAVLLEAFARFVFEGVGTPAPPAPTEHLVVGGLYRYVRNPMYLAVAAVILGQAGVLGSWALVAYALAFGVTVWCFVHWYEEPTLHRQFGAEYDAYRAAVPGWWPRAPRRAGRAPSTVRQHGAVGVVTEDGRALVLADGGAMPFLGLGVWQVPDGPECVNAVRWALELGYRHIDTAQAYGNERSVGQGLRESGVPRDEVFVTTKFQPRRDDPVAEAQRSLERLGLDHVDLYIVHWPGGGPTRAWPGMERSREAGYARSIGVSNFGVDDLEQVLATATVPPAVNQVQFSPYEYRKGLLDWCGRHGIVLEAYSTLGTGRYLESGTVARVAERHSRTPAQVLLRWCVERGVPVIPKSTHRNRIAENAEILDFRLTDQDLAELDALDRTGGTDRARERAWWRS